jgi:hypothetical protein
MSESFSSRGILVSAAALLWAIAGFAQSVPATPDASDLHHDLSSETAVLQPLEGTDVTVQPPSPDSPQDRALNERHGSVAQESSHGQMEAGKYDLRRIGQRGIGSGLDFYSLEKERALGLELSK